MFDSDPLENHLVLLIRAIAEKYLQVRYSYAAKHFTARLQTNSKINSRQTFTKLIQFSGQIICGAKMEIYIFFFTYMAIIYGDMPLPYNMPIRNFT